MFYVVYSLVCFFIVGFAVNNRSGGIIALYTIGHLAFFFNGFLPNPVFAIPDAAASLNLTGLFFSWFFATILGCVAGVAAEEA